MKRESESLYNGILYLISSPIGNLDDITYRALETLKNVDFLFCEDTRVTTKLLNHYGIKRTLDSFHDYSLSSKEDYIISLLKDGKSVGLISDCGTPLISDPGYEVVVKAREENIKVSIIPGASASISALIKSGLSVKPFMFYGFLDHKESKKIKELDSLKLIKSTIIFYESPLRYKETLKDMYEVFGNRKAALVRELTKMYEEVLNFELSEYNSIPDLKGEMVIVVEGFKDENKNDDIDYISSIEKYIKEGLSLKEACKIVSNNINVKSSDLYNEYLKVKK